MGVRKKEKGTINLAVAETLFVPNVPNVLDDGKLKLSEAHKLMEQRTEAVEFFAIGFDLLILFTQMLAIWLSVTTIYRSRVRSPPIWFGSTMCASSAVLAKYLVFRILRKSEFETIRVLYQSKLHMSSWMFIKARPIGRISTAFGIIYFFIASLSQVSFFLSIKTIGFWCFPMMISLLVFNQIFPPIPDLLDISIKNSQNKSLNNNNSIGLRTGASNQNDNQNIGSSTPISSDFSSLCIAYIAFRIGEGVFFTSILPIILLDNHYLIIDSTTYSCIATYVALSTGILLTTSTFFLNRIQLSYECKEVGYWKYKGNILNYDNLKEWDSEYSISKSVRSSQEQPLQTPSSSSSSSSSKSTSSKSSKKNQQNNNNSLTASSPSFNNDDNSTSSSSLISSTSTSTTLSSSTSTSSDCCVFKKYGYPKGCIVNYKENAWESHGDNVTRCFPGDITSYISYMLFSHEIGHLKSSRILFGCEVAQLWLLGIQVFLITYVERWQPLAHLLSSTFLGMFLMVSASDADSSILQPDQK